MGWCFGFSNGPVCAGRQTTLFCNYAENKRRGGLGGLMIRGLKTGIRFPAEQPDPLVTSCKSLSLFFA